MKTLRETIYDVLGFVGAGSLAITMINWYLHCAFYGVGLGKNVSISVNSVGEMIPELIFFGVLSPFVIRFFWKAYLNMTVDLRFYMKRFVDRVRSRA